MDFLKTGMSVFDKAKRSSVADKPFKVLSENGDLTVLPQRFAQSIRNENDLSFGAFIKAVRSFQVDMYPILAASKLPFLFVGSL